MNEETPKEERKDHGEVVGASRIHISVAWVFPVLAAAAAMWLFYSNWESRGPEIEIQFNSAPGMQVNKTLLLYRGVEMGKVTGIRLEPDMKHVTVKVQLQKAASELARKNSIYWIDQPELSLLRVSGLDAVIQGNSIHVRMGDGAPTTHFVGLNKPPLEPAEAQTLMLNLHAQRLPGIVRGGPIYYRGVLIGSVKSSHVDDAGMPYLQVIINDEYASLVRDNARFWVIAAASAEIGAGGLKFSIPGLAALLQGGIQLDYFGEKPGEPVKQNAEFTLYETEQGAEAVSPPIHISFENGMEMAAGTTELHYLGITIGLVVGIRPNLETGRVDVTACFNPGYDRFRRKGTVFALVRPKFSLKGVSGLETIGRGVYIECVPGPDTEKMEENFIAERYSIAELQNQENEEESQPAAQADLEVVVTANATTISPDAPVLYRGIQVGKVTRKALASDGKKVDLFMEIDPTYAPLIRDNTKFWDVGGLNASVGFFSVRVSATSLSALVHGGVAFATPNDSEMGKRAGRGQHFELYKSPRREWLEWRPSIPSGKR